MTTSLRDVAEWDWLIGAGATVLHHPATGTWDDDEWVAEHVTYTCGSGTRAGSAARKMKPRADHSWRHDLSEEARMPERIQRKRTKGWRMPEGAVYVGRGSRWGNPWREGGTGWTVNPGGLIDKEPHPPLTRAQAVESYRNAEEHWAADVGPERYAELRGRDLACWCPLDLPCHADVLLRLANEPA